MRSSAANPAIAALAKRFAEPLRGEGGPGRQTTGSANKQAKAKEGPIPIRIPVTQPQRTDVRIVEGRPNRGLIAALVCVALIPMGILIVMLWPGAVKNPHSQSAPPAVLGASPAASERSEATAPSSEAPPEIALTSPEKIDAGVGDEIDFAIAVDSEQPLPPRSLIAISAMPEGASFSQGRPYGVTGWSLRPDEIGELRLRLPKTQSGASDMHIELLAADGTRLAQSETQLNIAAAAVDEAVGAIEINPFQPVAQAADAPAATETFPLPARKPILAANAKSSVKVTTVKVVTIKAPEPQAKREPHDGAWALGQAAETPAEWVEIVSAVDMHVGPKQSSKTVKVAERGQKMRVTARDKNWVQISDPASSTQGWVYKRFLKPASAPASN
jgi:SH3 domain-containing protein